MSRPLWFLDVDGVLNADHQPGYLRVSVRAVPAWEPRPRWFKVNYSAPVVERIGQLGADLLDIVWLTTWGEQANTVLAPAIGLPSTYPVARELTDGESKVVGGHWWKWNRITEAMDDDTERRVVWTDDDIADDFFALNAIGALVIRPDSGVGLTMASLDRIEEFARDE